MTVVLNINHISFRLRDKIRFEETLDFVNFIIPIYVQKNNLFIFHNAIRISSRKAKQFSVDNARFQSMPRIFFSNVNSGHKRTE